MRALLPTNSESGVLAASILLTFTLLAGCGVTSEEREEGPDQAEKFL
jgi:hypothetical protein